MKDHVFAFQGDNSMNDTAFVICFIAILFTFLLVWRRF